jgi:hypothetical protein
MKQNIESERATMRNLKPVAVIVISSTTIVSKSFFNKCVTASFFG